jgi:BirA family biotin operon repressor/biotin-[acetyl-CoA-carboxylase] ligase
VTDLEPSRIERGLAGTPFSVEVREEVDSTQAALLREGGGHGRVLVADHQTAGRGRQGRRWEAPPGRALLFSVLLADASPERAPLQALRGGLAVARALEGLGCRARLKWPNDVLLGGRKVCGVLGEIHGRSGFVVLGVGLNVHQERGELPPGVRATSLRLRGVRARRDDLLVRVLRELHALGPEGWMDAYRARCATIGRRVRVELRSGALSGRARGVRADGALLVDGQAVLAGDVVHVRRQEEPWT